MSSTIYVKVNEDFGAGHALTLEIWKLYRDPQTLLHA